MDNQTHKTQSVVLSYCHMCGHKFSDIETVAFRMAGPSCMACHEEVMASFSKDLSNRIKPFLSSKTNEQPATQDA